MVVKLWLGGSINCLFPPTVDKIMLEAVIL